MNKLTEEKKNTSQNQNTSSKQKKINKPFESKQSTADNQNTDKLNKGRSMNPLVWIAALAAGIGGYFFGKKSDKKNKEDNEEAKIK